MVGRSGASRGPSEPIRGALQSVPGVERVAPAEADGEFAGFEVQTRDGADLREALGQRLFQQGWPLRRLDQGNRPTRRPGSEALHHLHIVEAGVSQQRMARFPIHNRRRLERFHVFEPVRVHHVNGQQVAFWPGGMRHVVENHEIEAGGRIN